MKVKNLLKLKTKKLNKKQLMYIAVAVMLIAVLFLLPLVEVSTSFTYKKTEKGLIYRDFIIESYKEIHHETNFYNPFDKEKWSDTVGFFLADNKEIRDMLEEYPLYKVLVKEIEFNIRTENEKYANVTVSCLNVKKSFEYPSDGSYSFEIQKEAEKIEIVAELDIVLKPYWWSTKSAKITLSNFKLYVTVWFGEEVTEEVTELVNETQTSLGGLVFNIPHFGAGQHFDFFFMVSWLDYAFGLSVIAIVILAIYVLKGGRNAKRRRSRKSKR